MAFNRKLLVATALCASAVLGLTACGGEDGKAAASKEAADPFEDLTPKQIMDRAEKATKSAKSLKVAGSGTSEGTRMDITFAVSRAGECEGSMSSEGAEANIVAVGDSMYIKANEAFWKQSARKDGDDPAESAAMVEMLKGRWMKVPNEAGSKEGMSGVCDLDDLLEETEKSTGSEKVTRGEDAEVDGIPAATLVKKDGKETSTGYVAKEGKPYLLRVVTKGGDEPGDMTLSDFDKPLDVKAPSADDTVDLRKLLSGQAPAA